MNAGPTRTLFAAIGVTMMFFFSAGHAATPENQMPGTRANLAAPTLGGTQFWRDEFVHAGWRIQQNVYTKHFRLLDPRDTRHAWGTFEDAKAEFDRIKRQRNIKPRSDELVILVHGIARSTGTFSGLENRLRAAGYDVVAVSYPSTRDTIDAHAEGLARLLDRLEGTKTVHFVTHSMGGLVVRHLLAADGPWKDKVKASGVVMIAPPNQGSAVARSLEDFPPYEFLYGISGQQLVPDVVAAMPAPKVPFIVIAGGKSDGKGFSPLLTGDDDGTVTVAETRLAGAAEHHVVPAIHATVSNHARTAEIVLRHLKTHATTEQNRSNEQSHGGKSE